MHHISHHCCLLSVFDGAWSLFDPYLCFLQTAEAEDIYLSLLFIVQLLHYKVKLWKLAKFVLMMICLSTGSVVTQRSDHGTSAPPMLQAAASAAGAPLVASPYPQSYLQYNPQQYSQQQVIQAMTPYPGQVGPQIQTLWKCVCEIILYGSGRFLTS